MEDGKLSLERLLNLNQKLIGLEKNIEKDLRRTGKRDRNGKTEDLDLRRRKTNELDPRNKRKRANQEEKYVAQSPPVTPIRPEVTKTTSVNSPTDFLFRQTRPTRIEAPPAPVAKKPAQPEKIRIHPYQDDTLFDNNDFAEKSKTQPEPETPPPPAPQLPVTSAPVIALHPERSLPPAVEQRSYQQPLPSNTHPSQLTIRPEELEFHITPYEPRPFAQHFITPVQGYLCKVCDRFFCTSEEAYMRHCTSIEHYDKVCRIVKPPPRHYDYRRPEIPVKESFERRREFVMATLNNYQTLSYAELRDNLLRRGVDIEGERSRLVIELERILKVEEKYPDAHGYFLLTVEENDLAGRKYKWFSEYEIRKNISHLSGVLNVIEANKRSLDCLNGKRYLWSFSVLTERFFPDQGMVINEDLIIEYQCSPLHVKLSHRLLNLKAFRREQEVEATPKNYIEI